MSSLSEKSLRLSKNVVFNVFLSKASKLLGAPFKVVTTLNEVADKLAVEGHKDSKFRQLFDTAATLVRLVRRYISGEYRGVGTGTVVSGLAVLLYVLSPIDLVPDFIPVLGFLDDLSLISWFAGKFQGEILAVSRVGKGRQQTRPPAHRSQRGATRRCHRWRSWGTHEGTRGEMTGSGATNPRRVRDYH